MVSIRRPTIIDVARLAGVSKATASRVVAGNNDLVREDTRVRVMEAVRQLGYERNAIAGSLRTNHTFLIALSIPDITNPFWPEVARGVQDTLEVGGYATVTVNSDWNADRERTYIRMVRRNRFDGLIINPTGATNAELAALGIPIVVIGSGDSYPDFDSVGSDTERATEQALDYLYQLGHRRIGLIAGQSASSTSYNRYHGYVHFLAARHIPLDESRVIRCEFSDQAGFVAMQQLLSLPEPPTAVVTANDVLAVGALKAARAMNRSVPDDVSIMGMDDIYVAATTFPALTTIAKQKYEIGAKAAELLLERMSGDYGTEPRRVRFPCTLVVRGSTASPPEPK